VGPVVINEILYAPAPFGLSADNLDEYVELRNITSNSVSLFDPEHLTNTWAIAGGTEFSFPTNTILAPWGYALVVHFDPTQDALMLDWFRARYGIATNIPIYGPFTGNLNNSGDRVDLYSPDTPTSSGVIPQVLVEEVNYSNASPWPSGADSTGYSLQRLSSVTFADDPANWQAATPSAGNMNAGAWTACSANDGLPDEWKLLYGMDPLRAQATEDPDGDGVNNLQEYIAGTNPLDPADYLAFDDASLTNGYFVIQFQLHAGRAYVVEQLNGIDGTNQWMTAFSTNATTDGACVFSSLPDVTNRFYRIKVTKP
jgi:hypothetical protein